MEITHQAVYAPKLLALLVCVAALGSACEDEHRGNGASAGSGGASGYGGVSGAGAGAGGEFGGAAGTDGLGGEGATGGTGGAVDAGGDASGGGNAMPCPPMFECVTDPIFNLLSACMPAGGMALPPECITDADCIPAGLPSALCLMEEETGLNGCVQVCTP